MSARLLVFALPYVCRGLAMGRSPGQGALLNVQMIHIIRNASELEQDREPNK
jgi:hypothetical protein